MKIFVSKNLSFSKNSRPLIIAEISCNHKGDKRNFLQHIRLAKKSGADLIKIQTYRPQDMTVSIKNLKLILVYGKGLIYGNYTTKLTHLSNGIKMLLN